MAVIAAGEPSGLASTALPDALRMRFRPRGSGTDMTISRRASAPLILLAAEVALPGAALAQQNSAAPEAVAPKPELPDASQDAPSVVALAPSALAPPPGAAGLSVTPGQVIVEGFFPDVADEVAALTQGIEGHKVTLADLYRLAAAIEAAHARHGYVLARVSVPPQRIDNGGTVRIQVVDGFIESVDVSAVPRRVRRAVAARLAGLLDRHRLRVGGIERRLLLAGEVAGVSLRSTLARGAQPGGVKLIVEGKWRAVRVLAREDNAIDRSLADATSMLRLSLNGLLGHGETIYGYAATSNVLDPFARGTRVRVVGGGLLLPLGDGRLTLNPEAIRSLERPSVTAGVPASEARLTRYALRAAFVLTETRMRHASLDLSLEALDQQTVAVDFATLLARDHYAAVRLGATVSGSNRRVAWSFGAQFGQGLGGLSLPSTVPQTRQGASVHFTKLSAQARVVLAVAPELSLTGIALAQSGLGHALLRAEQFQLEGSDAVSAYVGGVTTVDQGVTARAELARRVPLGRLVIAPYAFGAAGRGVLARPTAVEFRRLEAAAVGAGARVALSDGRAEIGVEWARGYSNVPALRGRSRTNLAFTLRF